MVVITPPTPKLNRPSTKQQQRYMEIHEPYDREREARLPVWEGSPPRHPPCKVDRKRTTSLFSTMHSSLPPSSQSMSLIRTRIPGRSSLPSFFVCCSGVAKMSKREIVEKKRGQFRRWQEGVGGVRERDQSPALVAVAGFPRSRGGWVLTFKEHLRVLLQHLLLDVVDDALHRRPVRQALLLLARDLDLVRLHAVKESLEPAAIPFFRTRRGEGRQENGRTEAKRQNGDARGAGCQRRWCRKR